MEDYLKLATLIIALCLVGCTKPQPPAAPDRSNIRPINDEASIQLIQQKIGKH